MCSTFIPEHVFMFCSVLFRFQRSTSTGLKRVEDDVFWSSDGIGESVTSRHKGIADTRVESENPFGDLQRLTMQGYLERRSFNGQWTK